MRAVSKEMLNTNTLVQPYGNLPRIPDQAGGAAPMISRLYPVFTGYSLVVLSKKETYQGPRGNLIKIDTYQELGVSLMSDEDITLLLEYVDI